VRLATLGLRQTSGEVPTIPKSQPWVLYQTLHGTPTPAVAALEGAALGWETETIPEGVSKLTHTPFWQPSPAAQTEAV